MKTIRIEYNTGDKIVTDINGTEDSIRAYYIGQLFNLGSGEEDRMAKAINVEFLSND